MVIGTIQNEVEKNATGKKYKQQQENMSIRGFQEMPAN